MATVAPELTLTSVEGMLGGATNVTLLARAADGSPWVYKPERGEHPLFDFAPGTLWRREVACHRMSAALDLGVVPTTLVADGPFGPGSAQQYLDEDFEWDPRRLIVEADPVLWPIVTLDLVTNNADRKIGHLLQERGRAQIWAIDNGLTFNADDKLRTVLWSFAGLPVPSDLIRRLAGLRVAEVLAGLLDPVEIETTQARVDRVVESPTHPLPPDDRHPYPWPVW